MRARSGGHFTHGNSTSAGNETNVRVGVDSGWGGDAGLLRLTHNEVAYAGGWPIQARVQNWAIGRYGRITLAYQDGPPPMGIVICKEGRTTGTTCGVITHNNSTNQWPGPNYPETGPDSFTGMLESTACLRPGDSGGPWTQANGEVAVGLSSAIGGGCYGTAYPTNRGEPLYRALGATGTVIYGDYGG